jgi:hypothetical protein
MFSVAEKRFFNYQQQENYTSIKNKMIENGCCFLEIGNGGLIAHPGNLLLLQRSLKL